jgi:hypothetical protein
MLRVGEGPVQNREIMEALATAVPFNRHLGLEEVAAMTVLRNVKRRKA